MAIWSWTGKQRTIYCLLEQTCVETSWSPKWPQWLAIELPNALSLDHPTASMMVFIETLFVCS